MARPKIKRVSECISKELFDAAAKLTKFNYTEEYWKILYDNSIIESEEHGNGVEDFIKFYHASGLFMSKIRISDAQAKLNKTNIDLSINVFEKLTEEDFKYIVSLLAISGKGSPIYLDRLYKHSKILYSESGAS